MNPADRSRRTAPRLRRLLACAAACAVLSPVYAFDLQGHRGTRGNAPENTLPAFERALEIGVDTLELDVGMTADGVLVIAHDPYLKPAFTRDAGGQWLAGAKGPLLRILTFAQLQAYDVGRINPESAYGKTFSTQQARDGTRVPTLRSLFDRVKALGANDVRFNIETKIHPAQPDDTASPEVITRALLKEIHDAGMSRRVTIQSFDWRTLALVKKLDPSIPTVCLTVQTANNNNMVDGSWTAGLRFADYGSAPKLVKAAGCAAWSPNNTGFTEALVKEAHELGLKVIPYTTNVPADMERFISWGVDGIITDYPERLREVMKARNMPLPKPVALR
jgi:glycerophosphoryl diester phosphodiesterase